MRIILVSLLLIIPAFCIAAPRRAPIIVDHTCTNLQLIPLEYLVKARHETKFYFGHTSHGEQVDICGLIPFMAANPFYRVKVNLGSLPVDTSAVCVMRSEVNPGGYWQGNGTRTTAGILYGNTSINVSGFMWCGEFKSYQPSDTQAYLTAMAALEAEFPNVTFVYFTSNCQIGGRDGTWVHRNNEMIRDWCRKGNRVLFDFGDLDCWHDGVYTQYFYSGDDWYGGPWVPLLQMWAPQQSPEYALEQCGHTTFESCELKARAAWWMFAKLAGWGEGGRIPGTPQEPMIEAR